MVSNFEKLLYHGYYSSLVHICRFLQVRYMHIVAFDFTVVCFNTMQRYNTLWAEVSQNTMFFIDDSTSQDRIWPSITLGIECFFRYHFWCGLNDPHQYSWRFTNSLTHSTRFRLNAAAPPKKYNKNRKVLASNILFHLKSLKKMSWSDLLIPLADALLLIYSSKCFYSFLLNWRATLANHISVAACEAFCSGGNDARQKCTGELSRLILWRNNSMFAGIYPYQSNGWWGGLLWLWNHLLFSTGVFHKAHLV